MINITIGKADATCVDKTTLTSGMVQAVQMLFQFSEEWKELRKVAVFSNGDESIEIPLDSLDQCYIPHEVLAIAGRDVTCGVYGSRGEGDDFVAIPTIKCIIGRVAEGVCPTGTGSSTPTPTIWDDHEQRITNLEKGGGGGGDTELSEKVDALDERVTSLEIPAGETLVEKTLKQLHEEGKVSANPAHISGNTFYTNTDGAATISIGGNVSFSIESNTNVSISIDGNAFDGTSYEGYADELYLIAKAFVGGSITFASIKVAEYKGGVVTAEQARTIINTKVFTEAEKSVVRKVSTIKDAGYVLSNKTLSDLYNEGKLVIDTSVTTIAAPTSTFRGGSLSGGTSATINFDCNVYIRLRKTTVGSNFTAIVDGVVLEGNVKTYKGYASVLQIIAETNLGVAFYDLQTAGYNGGYMVADSVKDIEKIKSDIGGIDIILDSIIAKQEAYIGTSEVSEVVEETEGGDVE